MDPVRCFCLTHTFFQFGPICFLKIYECDCAKTDVRAWRIIRYCGLQADIHHKYTLDLAPRHRTH